MSILATVLHPNGRVRRVEVPITSDRIRVWKLEGNWVWFCPRCKWGAGCSLQEYIGWTACLRSANNHAKTTHCNG